MQLTVEVIQHFDDDHFLYFEVTANTTRRALMSIEGVTKAKSRGKNIWEVWKDIRFYPSEVEQNIRTAFEAQED
ncbi:hypothetical protein LCGC14_3117200 [marine sediment metagenome]|uniref:Uncharacterized protein n=1 Tax=marine sediment metagenome TaxID=412755 RepID=A0A0F8YAT4_9ZZZZ